MLGISLIAALEFSCPKSLCPVESKSHPRSGSERWQEFLTWIADVWIGYGAVYRPKAPMIPIANRMASVMQFRKSR